MDKIEITINSLTEKTNFILDIKNNRLNINNQIQNITKKQIDDLLRIIRSWHPIYENKNLLDAESFIIKIIYGSDEEIIQGKGAYPDNYQLFKEWIGEFHD